MEKNNPYSIEILEVAHDIIDYLLESEPQNPGQIARKLGLTRSRVFRVLKSLEERGYVLSSNNGYILGFKFAQIVDNMKGGFDTFNFSKSILLDLAISTGDSAHLFARTGYHAVCIAGCVGENRLQVEKKVGEYIPMNVAGAPMVILAHLPEREQENIIKNFRMVDYTPNTITDRDELRRQLKQVYTQGYSIDIEEFMIGGCAVSAPIYDQTGFVRAAVSVETPSARFNEEKKDDIIKQVVKTAQQITEITARLFLQISKVDR